MMAMTLRVIFIASFRECRAYLNYRYYDDFAGLFDGQES